MNEQDKAVMVNGQKAERFHSLGNLSAYRRGFIDAIEYRDSLVCEMLPTTIYFGPFPYKKCSHCGHMIGRQNPNFCDECGHRVVTEGE